MSAGMPLWRIKNTEPGSLLEQAIRSRGLEESGLAGGELPAPDDVPGAWEAARRLCEAIQKSEKIAVFGDYDCDGVCGAFIMGEALKRAGADVLVRVPLRSEGFGLRPSQVKELAEKGAKVIVTVDNGTTAAEAAEAAAGLGVELIITDHHEPRGRIARCSVLVNPKLRAGASGFREYSGAGVAWLVSSALSRTAGIVPPEDLLDAACLATIVDVAPVTGPNRALARRGLEQMRRGMRPGLKALAEAAGVKTVGGWSMMWQLGPRINAAGRMSDAALALELLRSPDLPRARPLAEKLDGLNRERQEIVKQVVEECLASYDGSWFPVFVGDWPSGVVGVAAGRLAECLRRPVLVGREDAGAVKASGRTVGEFHVLDALEESRRRCGLPERSGGHAKACGAEFSVRDLPALRRELDRIARERLRPEDVADVLDVDGVIRAAPGINDVAELDRLEPFGDSNPEPVYALAGKVESVRRGDGWQMVRLKGMKFFVPAELSVVEGGVLHAAVTPVIDEWNGTLSVSARAQDVRDFTLTREVLAETYTAWRAGKTVPAPAKQVFEELGLLKDGPGQPGKKDLLESETFRKYGAVVLRLR